LETFGRGCNREHALGSVAAGAQQKTLRERAKIEDQTEVWNVEYEPATLEMLVNRADTIVVGHIEFGRPMVIDDNSVMTDYRVIVDRVIRRTKSPG
jgi:hypothetical protein